MRDTQYMEALRVSYKGEQSGKSSERRSLMDPKG